MTDTTYSLKPWTHPTTGETRIYVNGGLLARSHKLYIRPGRDAAGAESWDAKLWLPEGDNSLRNLGLGARSYDIGLELAERALKERGLDRRSFADILAILTA